MQTLDSTCLNRWSKAIAVRIVDEWYLKDEFPEDAKLLEAILSKLFIKNPAECAKLVGTGFIEKTFLKRLTDC